MSVVREDKFGLFVKTGGYIARPQVSERFLKRRKEILPRCAVGDKVKARHIACSGMAWVDGELWFTHGCYYLPAGGQAQSEACWDPAVE